MAEHAGAVIFGGPQSANDKDDFIKQEIDWVSVPLKENKPFLGICLGAQMMALNLGGTVDFHAEGQVEVGYYPIRPTDEGRAICALWPDHVYQWHREGFEPAAQFRLSRTRRHVSVSGVPAWRACLSASSFIPKSRTP